jgi:hypothetical protein
MNGTTLNYIVRFHSITRVTLRAPFAWIILSKCIIGRSFLFRPHISPQEKLNDFKQNTASGAAFKAVGQI